MNLIKMKSVDLVETTPITGMYEIQIDNLTKDMIIGESYIDENENRMNMGVVIDSGIFDKGHNNLLGQSRYCNLKSIKKDNFKFKSNGYFYTAKISDDYGLLVFYKPSINSYHRKYTPRKNFYISEFSLITKSEILKYVIIHKDKLDISKMNSFIVGDINGDKCICKKIPNDKTISINFPNLIDKNDDNIDYTEYLAENLDDG